MKGKGMSAVNKKGSDQESISVEDGKVMIIAEEIDLIKAIELKGILEKLLQEGKKTTTIAFRGMKNLSGTGFQVLSTVGRQFESLYLEGGNPEIVGKLKNRGVNVH